MTSSLAELTKQHDIKVKNYTRMRLQMMAKSDKNQTRLAIKKKCAEDIVFFANMMVVAFNPRVRPSTLPFVCFEKQEEFLRWAFDLKENSYHDKTRNWWGVTVKSRYTGASVLCCILLLHGWLFDTDFTGAVGSRKAELIYNAGNPDALFSKLQHMLEKLPAWLQPNWIIKRNLLTNLDNGNTIKGEAGDSIGRGGRSSLYILDEAAFVERSHKVIASLSENTDCVLMISTPNGTNNYFYQAYVNGSYPTFKITWRDDPRRSEEWYEAQCKRFDSVTIAQELDCDFNATTEGVIIQGKWINSAIDNQDVVGVRATQSYRSVYAGFDPAGGGKDSNVLVIRNGIEVIAIYEWVGLDTTESAEKVIQLCLEHKVNNLVFDAGGVGSDLAGTLKQRKKSREWRDKLFTFDSIQFGQSASDYYWSNLDLTSKDRFVNATTEMMYLLRERFFKTYQHVNGFREWDVNDLICIPNNGKLIDQLTVYTSEPRPNGKIIRISKQKLRENGIKSPDYADALALCFYNLGNSSPSDIW